MMRSRLCLMLPLAAAVAAGCADLPDRRTLAALRSVEPDVAEVEVENSLDLAMTSYRSFLDETPRGAMTPEAMRRLADLQIEKEFGIVGDTRPRELPAPEPMAVLLGERGIAGSSRESAEPRADAESDEEFERRATAAYAFTTAASTELELPGAEGAASSGPLEAIAIYQQLLAEYPNYERSDQVLYQMARAYDELGRTEEAMAVMERLVREHGHSKYVDEVQFRRGEYFFTRRMYREAEAAYQTVTSIGPRSTFYELALYKLGWTLYKQDFYEEALHQYMAFLDYKLSIGYDFDQTYEEEEERRIADTFRVISLSFSNLGGPEVLNEYYSAFGHRSYEDRIYRNLGEFYFDKLRYQDAAQVYVSFVDLYPHHRVAPEFSMRVIDIYDAGGFPRLVVESKKAFARDYGLSSEYWQHFDSAERPEVLAFLKTNLTDLANHYHALYQEPTLEDEKPVNYAEALVWYRAFLESFPQDAESPDVNYQLADLILENGDYLQAAREYERTAYDYAAHPRASAAGYAAIYAHREHLATVGEAEEAEAKRATVESSLRFADTFPEHEHAPTVLGAAAEDLYAIGDYPRAVAAARTLIERYPAAEIGLRRSAWTVVAHSSLELAEYPAAEQAYTEVLALTPPEDEARQTLVDNLAASIYKQGELANEAGDFRAAADHFLRIKNAAPTSAIRPAAEYDAGAALIRLEDWAGAAAVLDAFRAAFPEHELQQEATQQLAFVYQKDGQSGRAASEYARVADEAEDPALRADALLASGELYEQAGNVASAMSVYERYVAEFPSPVDVGVETRFKLAGMYRDAGAAELYHQQLEQIVAADASAGVERTDRTRFLAAKSALVLAERVYARFTAVRLVQPFEQSLAAKRGLMDELLLSLEGLIDYEVGEVTAAATYYMAEVYANFSRSLLESERPTGLDAAELAAYEEVIEEEAFPFEELAIEVHEKNVELIQSGVYNEWTDKSFGRLAQLMPGRYAKEEIGIGRLGALETVVYRQPNAPELDVMPEDDGGERRRSGRARKGPATRLEAVVGTGFTVTERERIDGDVSARYESAIADLEAGRREPALAKLLQIVESAPELVSPHIELGLVYAQANELESARTSFERALALEPAHPIALTELGLVLRRLGEFALARAAYEQALVAFPEFHYARKNLGIVCDLYLRDLECALEHYTAYAELVPDDERVPIWIADLRNRMNVEP